MRLRPVGPDALLIEVRDTESAQSLATWIRRHCPDVRDVVPAARSVLVDGISDSTTLSSTLRDWGETPSETQVATGQSPVITIPLRYDGPDLGVVAQSWGLAVADAIALHGSIEFQAAFCGFSPGFTYLTGLPSELAVPRLATPRTTVPVGAVAVADTWCAVYPSPSPGGWRILGTTDVQVWDQSKSSSPALITPGVRVRFVEIT